MTRIVYILTMFMVCLVYVTLYGFLRAVISIKLGDKGDEAKYRLSLNPLVHIDIVGFLFMLFFGVGFIKPMRNQTINFKNRKGAVVLISSLPTLIIFGISTILMLLFLNITTLAVVNHQYYIFYFFGNNVPPIINFIVFEFVRISLNVLLFNLIPIFPLDYERIFNYYVSPNLRIFWSCYDKVFQMALILLTIFGILPFIINFISNYYISIFV